MKSSKLMTLVALLFLGLGPIGAEEAETLPPLNVSSQEQHPLPKTCSPCSDWPVPARFTIQGEAGRGVGFTRGFSLLEGFVPLWQPNADSLFFADLRAVNFDAAERWEFNAGGGARAYAPLLDRVLGVNAFYDGRHTERNYFNQLGVGLEALGKILEFRANGYFILGTQSQIIGDTGPVNVGVAGGNIVFNRTQFLEVARGGVELEVGVPAPLLEKFYSRAYLGFYSYSAPGVTTANGIRGRLESQLSDRIALHLSIQNDQVFNTTVVGGLSFSFGAPAFRRGCCPPSWTDILGQRVHRDVDVVISQESSSTTTLVPLPPPPPPPGPLNIEPDPR